MKQAPLLSLFLLHPVWKQRAPSSGILHWVLAVGSDLTGAKLTSWETINCFSLSLTPLALTSSHLEQFKVSHSLSILPYSAPCFVFIRLDLKTKPWMNGRNNTEKNLLFIKSKKCGLLYQNQSLVATAHF